MTKLSWLLGFLVYVAATVLVFKISHAAAAVLALAGFVGLWADAARIRRTR